MPEGWLVARYPAHPMAEVFAAEAAAREAYERLWRQGERTSHVLLLRVRDVDPAKWSPWLATATATGRIPGTMLLVGLDGMHVPAGLASIPH